MLTDVNNIKSTNEKYNVEVITDKRIITDKNAVHHILIEGDNMNALMLLQRHYINKVDLIYIDPPYNTGHDFLQYHDKYWDHKDTNSHDNWLSMMEKRLKLAKSLLHEKGLLLISIGDKELAHLKLLCDAIFTEKHYRNTLVVSRAKKNSNAGILRKRLNQSHGYILVYSTSHLARLIDPMIEHIKPERWHKFDAPVGKSKRTRCYQLFGYYPPAHRHWMYNEKKAQQMMTAGLLKPHPNTGKPIYYVPASTSIQRGTNWMHLQENGQQWKFSYGEKNLKLIKDLIMLHPKQDGLLVLDFFAGSGTTGHAVVALNQDDDKQRQFILCTNNEQGIAQTVCYPRLTKVMQGYQRPSGKYAEGLGGNLHYLRVAST